MNIVLFDLKDIRLNLLPFTFTRPVSGMRVGILTIAEKWSKIFNTEVSYHTEDYLQEKYPLSVSGHNLFINGAVCPDEQLVRQIKTLPVGATLIAGDELIAAHCDKFHTEKIITEHNFILDQVKEYQSPFTIIRKVTDIFTKNADQIRKDFDLITRGRKSAEIKDPHTVMYAPENIFVEEGAVVKAAILNGENGPIYLGKNSFVQEGAIVKGSLALCEGAQINIGAKMRGDITVGPYSKVGGEVNNSVIFGYSNKSHDGFLGNSVLGEWCNMGADSNNSNLKNNYGNIKLWNYGSNSFQDTGLLFCGLMMGDHSKCGINTMFNTGTVVGVNANIFGAGFPATHIPSFAWGGAGGFSTYRLNESLETIQKVMERKGKVLDEVDKSILKKVYEITSRYRVWENDV